VIDVDAYSIYEIDEVVVLGNAAALTGTGGGQQEIVLVKTKRGKGPKGITVSAQTGPVNANGNGVTTDTRFYHQYYVGAWRNLDKVCFGVSANWLRDVFPLSDPSGKISTPYDLERWRLNGYFTWKPTSHNEIGFSINYTPQRLAAGLDSTQRSTSVYFMSAADAHEHLLAPQLTWRSGFGKGWTNDFTATYLTGGYNEQDSSHHTTVNTVYYDAGYAEAANGDQSGHFWARDRLAYSAVAGFWSVVPTLTVSYEHMKEQYWYGEQEVNYYGTSVVPPPPFTNISLSPTTLTYDEVFLTPAVDIAYRKTFDLLAGASVDASGHQLDSGRRVFPFASASLDVLKLGGLAGSSSLKVFGSYSQRTLLSLNGYTLSNLSRGLDLPDALPFPLVYSAPVNSPVFPGYSSIPLPTFWSWETGVAYSGWGGRLRISYWLEERNFLTAALARTNPNTNGNITLSNTYPNLAEWRSTMHHVDVRVMVLADKKVSWQTGLNVTLLRSKVDSADNWVIGENGIGDTYPHAYSYTGGWVNRLQAGAFAFGLDMLYHFGETAAAAATSSTASGGSAKLNSVVVPNVYLGYRFGVLRGLEVFFAGRGLVRNSSSDLMDMRRYYTVGGKVGL
jgi:hypothetical protein